jgi:hypothetical protein
MACSSKTTASNVAASGAPDPWAASSTPAVAPVAYTTLATTASGKALIAVLPEAGTPADAIRGAVYALDGFDRRPTITGAYQDRAQRRGGATFTGMIDGKPVNGTVLVGARDRGATVAVTYVRADAPSHEIEQLEHAFAAGPELETHALPGGAGSISIPTGWTIAQANTTGAVEVDGPAGQRVVMNTWAEVMEPRSQGAQVLAQYGQSWKALIAPYSTPAQALTALAPQLAQQEQATGRMVETLGEILEAEDAAPSAQGSEAQTLYYATTQYPGGQPVAARTIARIETFDTDPSHGGWLVVATMLTAPDASFEGELPTLMAIAQSYKTDDAQISANANAVIAAQNRWFDSFESSMRQNQAAFRGYMDSVRNGEKVREDASADFDEMLRGYRTIEDTRLGEQHDINLYAAHDVVRDLNEIEHDRWIEIPLRDQ